MVGRRRYTYADLEKLPENLVGELIDGELFASPRPGFPHAEVIGGIIGDLRNPFSRGRGGPGGWRIVAEPGVRLRDDVVVPDVAGWRQERLPNPPQRGPIEVPPDWVCEVLSPSNSHLDRRLKLPLYAKFGISHLWLVDPTQKSVDVFRLENERWSLHVSAVGSEKVRLEPFEAVEIDLATWWLPDPPTP